MRLGHRPLLSTHATLTSRLPILPRPRPRSISQIFEDYRKVYEFGRTWSYEEYSSQAKTLREIRRDMHKQREWRNELERMKIFNVVGCLYVDSKSLRNDLLPITQTTLDKIKLLLLNKSRETCLQVRFHVCVCVCFCMYVCLCACFCMYVCVSACVCVCMRACMCIDSQLL